MLSLSEVLTYFMEWQNGHTHLRILLSTNDCRFSFDCKLSRFWDLGISFDLLADADSAAGFIDLNLAGYDFEFLDEAAANERHEEFPAHPLYARGLKANRGPGETLFILEIATG
ncbi:MAG TPA: hypothetical protein VNB49_14635 [Candidatus Dormibacteraeota bacterium]|nr:hypothetical protein [Candidatus Dormibacteraeota bacterium]